MVLEVDLNNLVAQSEHNGMLCPHPLLNVDRSGRRFVSLIEVLVVFFLSDAE